MTKEEIFYTGKRNIEGFATLVSYFLPKLISSSLHPSLINVDNDEKSSQLFFQSSLRFKDQFTLLLGKSVKEVKTITVKIDFSKLRDEERGYKLQ